MSLKRNEPASPSPRAGTRSEAFFTNGTGTVLLASWVALIFGNACFFMSSSSTRARARASLMREAVTGWVCSSSGTETPPLPGRRVSSMRWKKSAMASGS